MRKTVPIENNIGLVSVLAFALDVFWLDIVVGYIIVEEYIIYI